MHAPPFFYLENCAWIPNHLQNLPLPQCPILLKYLNLHQDFHQCIISHTLLIFVVLNWNHFKLLQQLLTLIIIIGLYVIYLFFGEIILHRLRSMQNFVHKCRRRPQHIVATLLLVYLRLIPHYFHWYLLFYRSYHIYWSDPILCCFLPLICFYCRCHHALFLF